MAYVQILETRWGELEAWIDITVNMIASIYIKSWRCVALFLIFLGDHIPNLKLNLVAGTNDCEAPTLIITHFILDYTWLFHDLQSYQVELPILIEFAP